MIVRLELSNAAMKPGLFSSGRKSSSGKTSLAAGISIALGAGAKGFNLGMDGLIGSNTGGGAAEVMGTGGFMSRFNLAGVTGVTVGSLGLAIGAERKSSKLPADAVPARGTGSGVFMAGAAGWEMGAVPKGDAGLKRSSNPAEGDGGIIGEGGIGVAEGTAIGAAVGFGTGMGCDIEGAAIEGDGAMVGPVGGIGAFIVGVVSKSSKSDPLETFGVGACGLSADGTSTSISMASSSLKTSSEDAATASALTGALGAAVGAGAFKSPKGSSSSILCFKTSNPGLGGAGTAGAGDITPAGAGVPKDSTLVSFSQLAQMGCILESSPKQAPQKNRWQRLQFPTASRSAWFTQGVPGISQPFR